MMPLYRQETESSNIYQSRFELKNSVNLISKETDLIRPQEMRFEVK